jgi:hypothetical protein
MASDTLDVLLLCDLRTVMANAYRDHVRSFADHSRHRIHYFDPMFLGRGCGLSFNEFDAVVLHYSIYLLGDANLHPRLRRRLREYTGLKVQLIQDDYRHIDRMCRAMRDIKLDVLFSLFPEDRLDRVWTSDRLPGVRKFSTLAGYIPDYLVGQDVPPIRERPVDIGYRGRTVPFWLGELGQEKVQICERFLQYVRGHEITYDVSCREQDRIYGEAWPRFTMSCKAFLGTESGASITDFDSTIEKRTREYLLRHPRATFQEVHQAILLPYEGNVPSNVISPRAFEAAAFRTAMVLFPGHYSGILKPWRHYIPLEKDFSNFSEVVSKVRDHKFLEDLTERTYEEIVASGRYSYRAFIADFDEVLEANVRARGKRGKARYAAAMVGSSLRKGHPAGLKTLPFSRPFKALLLAASVTTLPLRVAYRVLRHLVKRSKQRVEVTLLAIHLLGYPLARRALKRYPARWRRVGLARLVKEVGMLRGLIAAAEARPAAAPTCDETRIAVRYDPATRALRFQAEWSDGRSELDPVAQGLLGRLDEALASGEIGALEFDHLATGFRQRVRGPFGMPIYLFLGEDHLYCFAAAPEVFRPDPSPAADSDPGLGAVASGDCANADALGAGARSGSR